MACKCILFKRVCVSQVSGGSGHVKAKLNSKIEQQSVDESGIRLLSVILGVIWINAFRFDWVSKGF